MEAAVVGAMATKLIDVAVDPLLGELLSRAKKQVYFVLHLENEIRFLRKILPDLKEVIWSAEVKPETAETRRVLQDFAEDAEDILDEFDTRTAQRRRSRAAGRQRNNCMRPILKVRSLILSRLKLANKIKGLYDGLEEVKSDLDKRRQFVASAEEGLRLAKKDGEGETELPRRPVTDELLSKDFRFVGREEMEKEVVTELLSEPLCKPSVILVTGMGGIGKTTFIQDVFSTPDFDRHFQIKKWVCVGDELDPKTVMTKILGRTIDDRTEICSELEGKRFLIVLDDCWSRKLKCWNDLWVPLTHGSDGSKVVITSRVDISRELEPASVKTYQLGILSDEECFQIFKCYAFPNGLSSTSSGSDSTSRLQEVGRKIVVQKIKGLPLAARILGSSLRYEIQEDAWNNVLTGVSDDDNIMSVLMWSYRRLPSHLKQCFSYLSLFPKDYRLKKEEMIRLWMAQGYVQPRDNLGKFYLDDLIRASLIQKRPSYGDSDIYYGMHDLVHDLAIYVSRGGCFPYNIVLAENYIPSSHLLIEYDSTSEKYSDNKKKLRTLLNDCKHVDSSKFQLQHVRALTLSWNEDLRRLNFSKMIHLRYLDLSGVPAGTLPESICGIYNLQTLLLSNTVENFPLGTWNLPNLRHLMGGENIRMTGISNSTSLQTISNFNLFNGGEDIEELGNLKELRGKLEINNLSHVQSPQSASKAQLDNKECIEELVLDWEDTRFYEDTTGTRDETQDDVFENLRPHESLRILKVELYKGDQFPSWMREERRLLNLVKLTLSVLLRTKELPPLGHLPKLEQLHIACTYDVKCIGNEFYGSEADVFPSLKRLDLMDMYGLEEWLDSTCHKDRIVKWFPSLEQLNVSFCRDLRSLPRLPRRLKMLDIYSTGLRALPEIWTCSDDDSDSYDFPCLETLQIRECRSLCPDEWFQKYRMPSLQYLGLGNLDGCIDLVVNYSRRCLKSLDINSMHALGSITLCNLAPVEDSREADYQELLINLMDLDVLSDVSVVNSDDGKTTAGPLVLNACRCKMLRVQQ